MTNEEMERAIEFLLRSQATLESRIEQTNEQLARTDEQLAQTNMVVSGLADTQTDFIRVMTRTLEAQAEYNISTRATHLELAAAQARTEATVTKLAEKIDRLTDLRGDAGRG